MGEDYFAMICMNPENTEKKKYLVFDPKTEEVIKQNEFLYVTEATGFNTSLTKVK